MFLALLIVLASVQPWTMSLSSRGERGIDLDRLVQAAPSGVGVASRSPRPLPARSAGGGTSFAALLAAEALSSSDWIRRGPDQSGGDPSPNGTALALGPAGLEPPTTQLAALLAPVHRIAECARRRMRTSGRHPPS